MRVTLKDISEAADVSVSTVSNILNNRPVPYTSQMRTRILTVAKELGYRPNAVARGLRRGRTDTVGLVIPNRRYSFFSDIAIAVEKYAKRQKSHVVTVFSTDNENITSDHLDELETLAARQVDGMIIVPPGRNEHVVKAYQQLTDKRIPIVLVDQELEEIEASFVGTDDTNGARQAVSYLIGKGHRRIAHLSGAYRAVSGQRRFEGYRLALEQAGLSFDPSLVFGKSFAEEDFVPAVTQLLDSNPLPTAVFCAHDLMAAEVYKQCWYRRIRIPDQISVIGFCGFMLCEYLTPPLTTMVQPAEELARRAMQMLYANLAAGESGEDSSPCERIYLPATMVERHSVRAM